MLAVKFGKDEFRQITSVSLLGILLNKAYVLLRHRMADSSPLILMIPFLINCLLLIGLSVGAFSKANN